MRKSKFYFISIFCIVALVFSGCNSKQKELELSKNVKQQVIDDEKSAVKLEKLKDLDLGVDKYFPVCWKDDNNIIATASSDNISRTYTDFVTPLETDISIYNINVNTSQVSKLKTIEKAYCGDLGSGEFYGKFLFMKDNSLWMYNANENSDKVIYDLKDVINEFKEPATGYLAGQNTIKESDIPSKIKAGFVKGSDRYIYIMSFISEGADANQVLRILDLNTGKVYKNSTLKGLFDSQEQLYTAWFYSKASDSFFATSMSKGRLYEYSLSKPEQIKNLKALNGLTVDITDDGNELLFMMKSSNSAQNKTSIAQYNIKTKKITKILYDNTKGNANNMFSGYVGIKLGTNNIISYDVETIAFNTSNKMPTGLQHQSYIANYDGKTIKNIKSLPLEKLDNKGNINSIIFNSKGDKFIYSTAYYDQGENSLKMLKTKSWVYQIK